MEKNPQQFLAHVQLKCIPATSSIDKPEYRDICEYTIHLSEEDFQSLSTLKQALATKSGSGFMQNQFIQVMFGREFRLGLQAFVQSSEELHAAMIDQETILDLVVVKYSKIQCKQLRQSVSKE